MTGKSKAVFASLALVLVILSASISVGCMPEKTYEIVGSGQNEELTIEATDFTKVIVEGSIDVSIISGSEYSVNVTVDENLKSFISVRQNGDTLNIKYSKNLDIRKADCHVSITMPDIELFKVKGDGVYDFAFVSQNAANTLEIAVDGNAIFRLRNSSISNADIYAKSNVRLYITNSQFNKINIDATETHITCFNSTAVEGTFNLFKRSTLEAAGIDITDGRYNLNEECSALIDCYQITEAYITNLSNLYYLGEPILGGISVGSGCHFGQYQS